MNVSSTETGLEHRISDNQLETISSPRAENVDCPIKRVEIEMRGDISGKAIHPLTEIDRLSCQKNAEIAPRG